MRNVCICMGVYLAATLSVAAQTPESEPFDEIIVEGQIQGGDDAMSAFLAGDYETAEIEFEKNYDRIRFGRGRLENSLHSLSSQARSNQASGLGEVGSNGQGAAVQTPDSAIRSSIIGTGSNTDSELYSGDDLGFQLYMAGLSELQLGKLDEAEDSFERALKRNGRLYDARMRLALLRLQNGDTEYARDQYAVIAKAKSRCGKHCRRLEEITIAEETLGELLKLYP